MGLTQVSKDGVKNDAIDASKLPANSVGASELADNAVDTNAIADQAVALSKLPHGDGSSNGKFLRANNGADPSFESIPAGTTINNNASTKFITGSNNANELDCETNLSYNNSIVNFANSNLSIDKSSNPTITLTESTGNKATQLRQDTGGLLRTLGNYPLLLGTNQQERMRLTGDGLVGIGMSSPSARFGIKGADTTNGTVELEPHANKGTSVSHIHYGATGDWYIRPASPSGYIYFDSGKTRFTNGILFGSDTAAANTLDDYEEGTFTPYPVNGWGITNGSALNSGSSAAVALGKYVRIGSLCYVFWTFKEGNSSGAVFNSNRLQFNGFPFQSEGQYPTSGDQLAHPIFGFAGNVASNGENLICRPNAGGAYALGLYHSTNGGFGDFTGTNLGNNGQVWFSGCYKVHP